MRGLWVILALVLAGCGGNEALKSANIDFDRGETERAYQRLGEALEEDADNVRMLILYAKAGARLEKDDTALPALDRAEAKGKREAKRVRTARRQIWDELYRPVAELLDADTPPSGGERKAARTLLARAERYDPSSAATYAARAAIQLMGSDTTGVAADLDQAMARAERGRQGGGGPVVGALRVVAGEYAARGDLREAVTTARHAATLDTLDVRANYELGVHLHRYGAATGARAAFEEAIVACRRVLSQLPEDAPARYNLALAHHRLGDAVAADREVREALRRAPWEAEAARLLARLRLADGDREGATVAITAARAADGDVVPVPRSVLDLGPASGREGRKRFVLEGPPARIGRYHEKSGDEVEVWFYRAPSRIVSFSGAQLLGELAFEVAP